MKIFGAIVLLVGFVSPALAAGESKSNPASGPPPEFTLGCKQLYYYTVPKTQCKSGVMKIVGGCKDQGISRKTSCA